MSVARRRALVAGAVCASGVAYAAAFPPWGAWPLAGVALVPVLLATAGAGAWTRLGLACLAALVGGLCGLSWLCTLTVGGWLLLSVMLAPYIALPLAAVGWARRRAGWPAVCTLPVALVAFECLRTYQSLTFPWLLLGHPLASVPWLAQVAAVGGAPLCTALFAATNGWLADACAAWGRLPEAPAARIVRRGGLALAGMWVAVLAWDAATWRDDFRPGPVVVGVQGNVPAFEKHGARSAAELEDQHVDLTLRAAAEGPCDLACWAETMAPLPLSDHPVALARVGALARTLGSPLLIGSLASEAADAPGARPRRWNSAFLLGPDGAVRARYDKIRLVPPTEWLPMRDVFPVFERIIRASAGFVPDLSSGTRSGALRVPAGRAGFASAPDRTFGAGVLICYEIVHADLARRWVREGADVLVNLTNENWFEDSAEFAQIWQSAVLRAIETRTPVVRVANTGWSGVIAPNGTFRAFLGEKAGGRAGATFRSVVPLDGRGTPFRALGDWVGPGALLMLLAGGVGLWRRRRMAA